MKVVHLGTTIQTQFALVDEDGDVIKTFTVTPQQDKPDALAVSKLTADAFSSAYEALKGVRETLQKQVDEEFKKEEE